MNELQLVLLIFVVIGFLLIPGVRSIFLNKKKPSPPPKGLGGWLILVGLSVILSPFILIAQVNQLYGEMLEWEDGTWDLLTTPGTEYYIEGFAPLIIAELSVNLSLILFGFILVFLFFKKHYRFPKLYIYYLAIPLIIIPFDDHVASRVLDVEAFDSEITKDYFQSWIAALIWIPYMLISKRVKSTFVEGDINNNINKVSLSSEGFSSESISYEEVDLTDSADISTIDAKQSSSSIKQATSYTNHENPSSKSVQDNQQPLAPDTTLEYFTILKYLARGGFGITYLALDTKRNRPVVIKEYFPSVSAFRSGSVSQVSLLSGEHSNDYQEGLRRFKREAMTLNEFKHPNIVEVIAYFEANNTAYFVMEHVEGVSLQNKLDLLGGKPFSEAEIKRDFLPVLKGLNQIHSINLLHLDIKPENILQTKFGEPILIDFGGARFATVQASHDHSSMVATTGYAPPEQYSLSQEQTPASDIYAFGMTLYQLMTGYKQDDLPDSKDRQTAILEDSPDPLKPIREVAIGYSEKLYKIVDDCTSVKKNARIQSISEIERLIS
jgi:hypothetical protein